MEQRFETVEEALCMKGYGKGLPKDERFEVRLWQLQGALGLKGSGKGRSLKERLKIIERRVVTSKLAQLD